MALAVLLPLFRACTLLQRTSSFQAVQSPSIIIALRTNLRQTLQCLDSMSSCQVCFCISQLNKCGEYCHHPKRLLYAWTEGTLFLHVPTSAPFSIRERVAAQIERITFPDALAHLDLTRDTTLPPLRVPVARATIMQLSCQFCYRYQYLTTSICLKDSSLAGRRNPSFNGTARSD